MTDKEEHQSPLPLSDFDILLAVQNHVNERAERDPEFAAYCEEDILSAHKRWLREQVPKQ